MAKHSSKELSLTDRWERFFAALRVVAQRGYEWRGGVQKLTFSPNLWIPKGEKAIAIYESLSLGTDAQNSQSEVQRRIVPVGSYVQNRQRAASIIEGVPWPVRYRLLFLVPSDKPGKYTPSQVASKLYSETAFGFAASSGRMWVLFGDSKDQIQTLVATRDPLQVPMLPLDMPWGVIGEQLVFNYGDQPDPRVTDGSSSQGVQAIFGHLTTEQLDKSDPLHAAYLAAMGDNPPE